jgi:hypothetical protein
MWRKYMRRVVVLSAIGLAGYGEWWLYDFGKLNGVEELRSLRAGYATLARQYRDLARESDTLRERNAILERSSQIDQQAAQDIQRQLASLQEELQAAREEIEFYRGIIAPGDVTSGLRIHRFELTAGLHSGDFHYDLVLTQIKHNDHAVTGLVEWKIFGKHGDKARKLNLSDVTRPEIGHLDFKFRYFQHLTGNISLPPGFQAQKVVLSVKPAGKDAPDPIEQSFEWPVTGS